MKDLEKLIEETIVPDMECAPNAAPSKKRRSVGYITSTEIPEVVLPKTRTEEYLAAKNRLTQKTKAVSKRVGNTDASSTTKPQQKRRKVKTVDLEIAAVTETTEQAESEQIKYRKNNLKNPDVEPVWVGSPDDMVPFAWRFPLMPDMQRPSKMYRQTVDVNNNRRWLLPVPTRKE